MTQRSHRRYAALAGGILVVAIALTLATRSGSANAPAAEPPPVLAVRTVLATEASWPQGVPAVGSIAAWQEVVIGAELGGQRLAQLLVDVGDPVRRGDLLAVLGSGTLQAELEASRAALREAEALALEAGRAAERARSLQGTEVLSAQAIDEAIAASEAAPVLDPHPFAGRRRDQCACGSRRRPGAGRRRTAAVTAAGSARMACRTACGGPGEDRAGHGGAGRYRW
jgi:multidrug efflux pump subunit AcrA (membrane-fusion protein)